MLSASRAILKNSMPAPGPHKTKNLVPWCAVFWRQSFHGGGLLKGRPSDRLKNIAAKNAKTHEEKLAQ
jgi:hypothetical protein